MQKVHLVNSELEVSRLAFGCWGITDDAVWGERDSAESTRTILAELGLSEEDIAGLLQRHVAGD